MKIETLIDGENFMHRTLWLVADRAAAQAEAQPMGSIHDHLIVMVFSLLAFEAYLNFLGDRLDPALWKDESNPKSEVHRFKPKIRKVFDLIGKAEPEADQRPYLTIWQLRQLRDSIAHGKVQRWATKEVSDSADEPPWSGLKHIFDGKVSAAEAVQARDDVQELARQMHKEAGKARGPDGTLIGNSLGFGPEPFVGVHGAETTSRKLLGE